MAEPEQVNPYESWDLAKLAKEMVLIREQHTELKQKAAYLWAIHENLAKTIIPERMEEMGIGTVNITGVGRLEIRNEASCSIPAENKEEVYAWCNDNGYGDLIQGTINSGTFKAQVKKWIKEGEEFPLELIKFNPYDNAVIVKAK